MTHKQVHPTYMDDNEMVGVCTDCKMPIMLYNFKYFSGDKYCRKCIGSVNERISKDKIRFAAIKALEAIKDIR